MQRENQFFYSFSSERLHCVATLYTFRLESFSVAKDTDMRAKILIFYNSDKENKLLGRFCV